MKATKYINSKGLPKGAFIYKIKKDMDADVLILDRELNIRAAWAMGRLVEDTNTLF